VVARRTGPNQDLSDIERLAASVADNGGVYFVPALVGSAHHIGPLRSRHDPGLTRGTTRPYCPAALEAIAYQTCDVLRR